LREQEFFTSQPGMIPLHAQTWNPRLNAWLTTSSAITMACQALARRSKPSALHGGVKVSDVWCGAGSSDALGICRRRWWRHFHQLILVAKVGAFRPVRQVGLSSFLGSLMNPVTVAGPQLDQVNTP
jgi:hypothetical protein